MPPRSSAKKRKAANSASIATPVQSSTRRPGKRPASHSSSTSRKHARSAARKSGTASSVRSSSTSAARHKKNAPRYTPSSTDGAYVDDDDEVFIPEARMHTLPETTVRKWTAISAPTKQLFSSTMDNVLRSVLGGYSGGDSRGEAEAHLVALKSRIIDTISKTKGPAAPVRRKVTFSDLSESTRQNEEALLNCLQQIRKLEAELEVQRKLLGEEEAHFETFVQSMKSSASHTQKQHKKNLHPLLRNADLDFRSNEWESNFGSQSDLADEVDDVVSEVLTSVHTKLVSTQPQIKKLHHFLDAVHRICRKQTSH